jgi:DNA-binding MarR family transcriptional regulator
MRPQSMGAVIAALEEVGLVTGAPDPEDRRQTILSLTRHCQDWLQQSRAARQDWLRRAIEARFSPEEQEHISSAVILLKRLIEE